MKQLTARVTYLINTAVVCIAPGCYCSVRVTADIQQPANTSALSTCWDITTTT